MNRTRAWLLSLAALAVVGLAAPPQAQAQRRSSYGFWDDPGHYMHRPHAYIGARGVGLLIIDEVSDYTEGYLGNGGGFGLFAGVKLNAVIGLEFNWNTTWHDEDLVFEDQQVTLLNSLYLMTFTGDLKLHFPNPSIVDPFFLVGGGYARLGADYTEGFDFDETFADGATFEIGGGLNVWINPYLSIGGQIFYRGIWFSEPDFDPRFPRFDNYVSGLIFDADLAIHF